MQSTRRSFLQAAGTVLGATAISRAGAATLPEAPI